MERVYVRALLERNTVQARRVRQESRDDRFEKSLQAHQSLLAQRVSEASGRAQRERKLLLGEKESSS